MDNTKIGDFLKSLRKANGYTQEEVADKLLVSPKTISRWECGDGLPDINIISSVADLYGVTVDELLKGERSSKDEGLKEESINLKNKNKDKIIIHSIVKKFNIFFYISLGVSLGFTFIGFILTFFPNAYPLQYIFMVAGLIASIVLLIVGDNSVKEAINDNAELLNEETSDKIKKMLSARRFFVFDSYVFTAFVTLVNMLLHRLFFTSLNLDLAILLGLILICYFIYRITYLITKDGKKTLGICLKVYSILAIIFVFLFGIISDTSVFNNDELVARNNTFILFTDFFYYKYLHIFPYTYIVLALFTIAMVLQIIFVCKNMVNKTWISLIIAVASEALLLIIFHPANARKPYNVGIMATPTIVLIVCVAAIIIICKLAKKMKKEIAQN